MRQSLAPEGVSFAKFAVSLFTVSLFLICCAQSQEGAIVRSQSELLRRGLQAYRTGKFDAAVENYQAALQQEPKSGEAYVGLIRTYLKQEKVQMAFETASTAVQEVPDSVAAHVALGEVCFRQGKMVNSETELRKGLSLTHPIPRAYLGLGRLYEALSLGAKAKAMLAAAYELDPNDPDIQRDWMKTLPRRQEIQALEKYLSNPTDDDEETLEKLRAHLDLQKEREKQPGPLCKLVAGSFSAETELSPMMLDARHLEGYGLDAKVNGRSLHLLLDTGASGLLIRRRIAEKAGIKPLVTTKLGGIGDKGSARAYLGYADSIKVGKMEFQNCLIEASDSSHLDIDGLIGADVFRDYLVTIDFPGRKLKLKELPVPPDEGQKGTKLTTTEHDGEELFLRDRYIAPEMESYTRIWHFRHNLLIPTKVQESSFKLFLIDTGASTNTISPEAARAVTKVRDSDVRIHGLSGAVKRVYEGDKATLEFAHLRQKNQDIITIDLSNISKKIGVEVSGILGFDTLRFLVVKIDYRDGLVDFEYDAKRWR